MSSCRNKGRNHHRCALKLVLRRPLQIFPCHVPSSGFVPRVYAFCSVVRLRSLSFFSSSPSPRFFFTFSGPPRVSLRMKHSRDDLIDERDLGTERERNNLPRCILFFFFFFVSDGHTWHDCDELYTGPIEAEPRWVME